MGVCQARPRRQEIAKKTPGISFDEIGKQIGEEWRAMSDADKQKYRKKAEKASAKYHKEKGEVAAPLAGGQRPEHSIEERKDLHQRPHKNDKQEERRSLKRRKQQPREDDDGHQRTAVAGAAPAAPRGSSRFRGVTWNKAEKKWKAQLQQEGKKIMLYVGDDEEEAARAWDVAAAKAGRTNLNFSTACGKHAFISLHCGTGSR